MKLTPTHTNAFQLTAVHLSMIKDAACDEFRRRPDFTGVDPQAWCVLSATKRLLESWGVVVPYELPQWVQEDSFALEDGLPEGEEVENG